MEAFTIQEYMLDLGRGTELFTSVICTEEEFNNITELMRHRISSFKAIGGSTGGKEESIRMIKKSKYIPLVWRGTNTEWVFEYFGVRSEVMGIITKGYGVSAAQQMGLSKGSNLPN